MGKVFKGRVASFRKIKITTKMDIIAILGGGTHGKIVFVYLEFRFN